MFVPEQWIDVVLASVTLIGAAAFGMWLLSFLEVLVRFCHKHIRRWLIIKHWRHMASHRPKREWNV